MSKTKKINIEGTSITVLSQKKDDFISLTDMAKSQLQDVVIIKWLSLKSTIEYLGEWEALYNPDFNYTEFGTIKNIYFMTRKVNTVVVKGSNSTY